MPSPKFIVSSRATKGGPTQQVTIPAAIARKLPQGISIRWEVSLVKGGLYYKYLGPHSEVVIDTEIELDFVPAGDLKLKDAGSTRKKPGRKPAPVEEAAPKAPEEIAADEQAAIAVIDEDDVATDSTAEQAEDVTEEEVVQEDDLEDAPF